MDVPSTVEALVVIALVLAPGYIFTRTISREISQVEEPPDLRFLVTTITWGLVIHALLLLRPDWPHQIPRSDQILDFYLKRALPAHASDVACWALISLVLFPLIAGYVVAKILENSWIDKKIMSRFQFSIVHRTPTAWQYVVNQEQPAYVLVHLKDGRVIGGCYGRSSFTSDNPRHGDIYLETRCHLNDAGELQFGIPDSKGVWIAHDVIGYMDFLGEFPTTDPKPAAEPEPTDGPKTRPDRGEGTSTERFIEAAATAALVQVLWRIMKRLCRV